MIDTLGDFQIFAERLAGHPGVYVDGKKIGSLGLRIKRNCSYHGLALNVDMDLTPFHEIDPCGISNMAVTHMAHYIGSVDLPSVQQAMLAQIERQFNVSCESRTLDTMDLV